MNAGGPSPGELAVIADLYENAPCGHVSTTIDGLILRVNSTFVEMTGYERHELEGRRHLEELMTAGGRLYNETHLRPLIHLQGHLREVAIELVRADGSRLPTLINSVVRGQPGDEPAQVHTVVLDATERHSYERELLVANRRIERLGRVAERFGTILSPEQVAEVALTELVDGIKADYGMVALLDAGGDRLDVVDIVAESDALADAWRGLRLADAAPLDDAVRSGQPAFIAGSDGHDDGVPLLGEVARATRLAVLPLVVDGESRGLLCLGSRAQTSFKVDESQFLVSFARLCAQALERGRLHQVATLAARRASFMSVLGRALEERMGYEERARCLVDLLVPEFADFATIEVPGLGPRPVAAQHRDPELLEQLLTLRESANVAADKPHSMARARATGQPQLLTEISEAVFEDYDQGEAVVSLLRRLSPRSYVGLPLRARGEVVGSLMLVMSESARRYTEEELPFLVRIADRAGLALENARLYEHEREVAQRLQLGLLPQALPADPRLRVIARYRPSAEMMRIGGDWYDAFVLPGDRLALAVGDVVGHNVEAAMVMGQLRTALRAFALDGGGCGSTIERLSRFSASVPGALATTVAYAELDPATGMMTYACAGHLPPMVFGPSSEPRVLWEGRSPPLGTMPEVAPPVGTIRLEEETTVLFLTDGLIERRGISIDASIDDLLGRLAARSTMPLDGYLDDLITSLFDGVEQTDDICVLAVTLAPSGRPRIPRSRVRRRPRGERPLVT